MKGSLVNQLITQELTNNNLGYHEISKLWLFIRDKRYCLLVLESIENGFITLSMRIVHGATRYTIDINETHVDQSYFTRFECLLA